MTHLRVRLREIITDHAAFICSSEVVKDSIVQLAYELTANLDAQGLLEFSKEVLPAELHTQVRAFLADKYPLLLASAEVDLVPNARFGKWSHPGGNNQV